MSFASIFSFYLLLNALVLVGFVALMLTKSKMNSVSELKLHYFVLQMLLIFVFVSPFVPSPTFFEPIVRVDSANSYKTFAQDVSQSSGGFLKWNENTSQFANVDSVSYLAISLFLITLSFALYRIYSDIKSLHRIRKKSFLIRKIGQVSVLANEDIQVPFSYAFLGKAFVVLPSQLINQPQNFKIALLHELQHHRQKDTSWVYLLWLIRLICVANPVLHLWSRWISEIQEFACDEALVDQQKVDSQAYASCLLRVAQTAVQQKHIPACATGLVFLKNGHILRRRIEKMLHTKNTTGRSIRFSMAALICTLMASVTFASKNWVQDRRITMKQAQEMLRATEGMDFPVVLNDRVLKQLNKYLGTPDGRKFMRESLQRMQIYQPIIESKMNQYSMPRELLAVPIIESGYKNLEQSSNKDHGAGLWMFITSTARKYGMTVDENKDERLDVVLETDAAMRYLKSNYLLLNDWQLALMGYNMGENRVQKAIQETGSRDAWELIEKGYENDWNYLAKFMAVLLIMKNPSTVQ